LGFEVYGYEKHALKVGETYVDEEHRVLWLQEPTAAERTRGHDHPSQPAAPRHRRKSSS
jgi:hypothetical protein